MSLRDTLPLGYGSAALGRCHDSGDAPRTAILCLQSRGGGAGQPKLWPVSCTFVAGICRPLTPIATRLWHGCGTKPQPHARAGIVSQSSAATPVPEESRRNPQAPHLRHIPDNYDHTAVRAYGWGYAKTKSPAGEWVRSNYGGGRGTGLVSPPAVALV